MAEVYELPADDQEKDEFVSKVQHEYRIALDKTNDWRSECEAAYDFVAGDQWSDDDKAKLEDELRPVITFNRMDVFVSAVTGMEILNREEVRYIPRVAGDRGQGQADLLNGASKYIADDTDAETAHSEAFFDLALTGMGWTLTRLDFETNPDGDICIDRIDPLSMYWDPRATKKNLEDAKWFGHLYKMSMDEVAEDWPDRVDDIQYSKIFDPGYEIQKGEPHHADKAWMYARDQARRRAIPDEVYVLRYQYYMLKPFYRVWMPDGQKQDLSVEEWKQLQEMMPPELQAQVRALRLKRRQYRQAYIIGDTLMEDEELPVQEGFSLTPMTGKRDRNDNVWYGLYRAMRDPQTWVNKFFSQILHIINSNAKGGIMAERGAFESPSEAQRNWSRPDRITWLRDGALQEGKILQKQPIQYPQGLDRLMQYAMQSFHDVTGISLELLGLANRDQPGVLEHQRKQAGVTILAWAFDAMRAYRKKHGRILANFIREYIADGRLVRITADGTEQYIPLVRDELAIEYDIVVSTSPHSPTEKERVFGIIMEMLPSLINLGAAPPPEVLDYMPLPAVVANAWKESIQRNMQSQSEQAEQQTQIEQQRQQAEAAKLQSEAAENYAEAALDQAKAGSEQAIPALEQAKLQLEQAKIQTEILKNMTK